jgi:hypothetical protein
MATAEDRKTGSSKISPVTPYSIECSKENNSSYYYIYGITFLSVVESSGSR